MTLIWYLLFISAFVWVETIKLYCLVSRWPTGPAIHSCIDARKPKSLYFLRRKLKMPIFWHWNNLLSKFLYLNVRLLLHKNGFFVDCRLFATFYQYVMYIFLYNNNNNNNNIICMSQVGHNRIYQVTYTKFIHAKRKYICRLIAHVLHVFLSAWVKSPTYIVLPGMLPTLHVSLYQVELII